MTYEDVRVKCFYCDDTIEGNQKYMVAGGTLPGRRGQAPRWLKKKPEHKWAWNGLSSNILGQYKGFNFYLCPSHQTEEHFRQCFEWAQTEIDGLKALAKLVV